MRKVYQFCIAIIILLNASSIYFIHTNLGFFKTDSLLPMNTCNKISGPYGPEDLDLAGKFIVSGWDNRVPNVSNPTSANGGLIFIDPVSATVTKAKLEGYPHGNQFHPLGLHVFNNDSLYVINIDHAKSRDCIEKFVITAEDKGTTSLRYVETIRFEEPFYNQLNDVWFVAPNTFYATTWHIAPGFPEQGTFATLKGTLMQLFTKSTFLLRCEIIQGTAKCHIEDHGHMMNGIARRGNELFAVDTSGNSVNRYRINPDFSLSKLGTIDLTASGDNISYDPVHDRFYVGILRARDYLLAGPKIAKGERPKIPGGVAEIYQDPTKQWKSRILFMQDELSGVSTALRVKNQIMIGSWMDAGVLVCPIKD